MSKKGSDTPAPAQPDPYATAQAQTQSNVQTAIANTAMQNADEVTPFGNVNYYQTGTKHVDGGGVANPYGMGANGAYSPTAESGGDGYDVPTYTRVVTLSEAQQRLLNAQQDTEIGATEAARDAIPRLASIIGSNTPTAPTFGTLAGKTPTLQTSLPLRTDAGLQDRLGLQTSVPLRTSLGLQTDVPLQTSLGLTTDAGLRTSLGLQSNLGLNRLGTFDPGDVTSGRDRAETALMARLNPQLAQSRDALEAKLVNQGLVRGTEAFNTAADEASRQENDARLAVIAQAGQEQDRDYDEALRTWQAGATATGFNNDAATSEASFRNQALTSEGTFYNQAALDAANLRNSALSAEGTFRNQSTLDAANFRNQALAAEGAFGNAATLDAANFRNSALTDEGNFHNQAALAGTNLYNAATLDQANFYNQAVGNQYGLDSSALQYDNAQAQQAFQNAITSRELPINEVSSLLGLGQVQVPQSTPYRAGTVDGTPVGQYVYQGYNTASQNWQAQQKIEAQESQGLMSGIFGLGSTVMKAGIGKSDRRLKSGIVALGVRLPNGLPLYAYRIEGREEVGVMADEVAVTVPEAVVTMTDGYAAVDYARVVL